MGGREGRRWLLHGEVTVEEGVNEGMVVTTSGDRRCEESLRCRASISSPRG